MIANTTPVNNTIRGKVIYLLVLVALNQFVYPMTQQGGVWLVVYQFLYVSMFVAGIYVTSDSRRHVAITAGTALVYLVFGLWYALDPTEWWKILGAYVALLPYLATVVWVLLRYIFGTRVVDRDVLYAAICVYLLLGGIFVPVYGILETLWPGSFVDNAAPGGPVAWQQLLYYSYVTLTTAGYGDILPVSWWARSLANLEAVIGVLYVAVLMGRLVGLYSQER